MASLLLKDSVDSLVNSYDSEYKNLVMQVVDVYPGSGHQQSVRKRDKFGITISDGALAVLVMLSPKLNKYIVSKEIAPGSFVRIQSVCRKVSSGYRIITVLKAVPVGKPTDIIGTPVEISLRVPALVVEQPAEPVTANSSDPDPSRLSASTANIPSAPHAKGDKPINDGPAPLQEVTNTTANGDTSGANSSGGGAMENGKVDREKNQKKTDKDKGESRLPHSGKATKRAYAGLPKKSGAGGSSQPVYPAKDKPRAASTPNLVIEPQTASVFSRKKREDGFIRASEMQDPDEKEVVFSELSTINPDNWFVYARIEDMIGPYSYASERGSGRVLVLKLRDKANNLMRAVFFDEPGINGMRREGSVGAVLRIANAKVGPVKDQFKYEGLLELQLNLTAGSDIDFLSQDHGIKDVSFPLTDIKLLRGFVPKSKVNVLGVIVNVGQLSSMRGEENGAAEGKDGEGTAEGKDGDGTAGDPETSERKCLELQLVDKTSHVVRVVLWDGKAVAFKGEVGQALLLKKVVVVAAHGGVSLNVNDKAEIVMRPTIDGASDLVKWYKHLSKKPGYKHISSGYSASSGLTAETKPRPRHLTTTDVLNSNLGHGSRIDTFYMEGPFTSIHEDTLYEACVHPDCSKNVEKSKGVCPIAAHRTPPDDHDGEKRWCYKLRLQMGLKKGEIVNLLAFSPAADEILGDPPEEVVKEKNSCPGVYEERLKSLIESKTVWKLTVQARTRHWKTDNGWSRTDLQYQIVAAERKEDEDEDDGGEEAEDEPGDDEDDEEEASYQAVDD